MTFLRSLSMAFSCFSRVPMPQVEWKPESMRYMMCFFPLIGLVIGVLVALWVLACETLSFDEVLVAAGVTVIPLVVTGGIHMDGFCDVVDAQASHADPARKREILKDPHTGAFAIIAAVAYAIAYFAFASQLDPVRAVPLVCGMHCVSRCLSGVATVAFPKSGETGMLATFGRSAEKRRSLVVLVVEFLVFGGAMSWISPVAGPCMVVCAVLVLFVAYWFARIQFGGMSGDLAGWFLQVAELAMLVCLAICTRVVPFGW